MTEPDPSDELLARYREACAADPRVPAERVRAAVRAHAQMVAKAEQQAGPALTPHGVQPPPAANDPRWKMSALASVAVLGLAGLLILQLEHGTPEQKEVALGVPVPGQPRKDEAVVRQSAPAVADARKKDAVPGEEPPPTGGPTQTAPTGANAAAARRAQPTAPPAVPDLSRSAKAAAPATGAEASRAPSAFPRSPEPNAGAAQPIAGDAIASAALAAPAPITAQLNVPAAAPRDAVPPPVGAAQGRPRTAAPAGAREKADNPPGLAQSLRERAPSADTSPDPGTSLHGAARNGDVAQLDRLLALGGPLNARDEAGRTPLILATMHGHIEAVRRLLAAGANPALPDSEGLDALQHARRQGLNQIVQLIEARR